MHNLTEKESALLEGYKFDCSFLTYQETKEGLVSLCERTGMGLVEEVGSCYNAFLVELTLPRINADSLGVKSVVEWHRNKGLPYLSLHWTDDTTAAYINSKRVKKNMYDKILAKMVGNVLTEFSLLY